MYCTKCGKELNYDAKFCDGCGMSVDGIEVKEAPKKRKKTGLIIAIVAIVLAFIIGVLALIGWATEYYFQNLNVDDYDLLEDLELEESDLFEDEASVNESEDTATDSTTESYASYNEVFSSRNIIDSPASFIMLDSASFVLASADGMVEKLEFGYEDDLVKEMVNTVYYPISGLSAEEVDTIDSSMRTAFSIYEAEDFCSVSYNALSDYFVITISFSSLDKAENVQKLGELGMLTGTDVTVISMTETESGLIANGYIKK